MAKKKETSINNSLRTYSVGSSNPLNLYTTYTGEFTALKSDYLKNYFEQARKGVAFFLSLLFEDIRRKDLRIGAVCQTRRLAVTRKEWKLVFREDSPLPEQKQMEIRDFVYAVLEEIDMAALLSDIVEAQISGLSYFEIVYKLHGHQMWLDDVCRVDGHLMTYDDLNDEYGVLKPDCSDAILMRTEGRSSADDRVDVARLTMDPMDERKILIAESLDGNSANGLINGCITSLVWSFFFKNYGLKDWASYVERFATPAIVGKYPSLMSPSDKQTLKNAVRDFGHLFRVLIPEGASLDILRDTAAASSNEIFDRYTGYWDKNATIRVLGQSLTTDIGDVGSRAAAETHDTVRNDLVVSDMMLVTNTMNKLIRKLISLNYGDLPEIPKFKFLESEDPQYKLTRSQILVNLKQAGYIADQEDVEKEFGWKLQPVAETFPPVADQGSNYIRKFIREFYDGLHR